MEEKRYLKWYNKAGYGAGDIAGNVVYALLAAFVMIYLTDTVGLNAGIVGTLIAVSKIFDGISDVQHLQPSLPRTTPSEFRWVLPDLCLHLVQVC